MALIVEDGTGLANAESYVSVADSIIYHNNRGATQWAGLTTVDQERALRRATEYMVGYYGMSWLGTKTTAYQALDWPRNNVRIQDGPTTSYISHNVIPQRVKDACSALALRAASGPLLDDQTQKTASVTVGPITTSFADGSSPEVKYLEIDNMLKAYRKTTGGQILLVRR